MLDLLASAGHSLEEIKRSWSPAMVVRMAEAAGRRRRMEWFMHAQSTRIAIAAAFSKDSSAMKNFANALRIPYGAEGGAAARAAGGQMGDTVADLYAQMGARYGGDGR